MATRVSTGNLKLDDMLGGGLLPGTLTVVYGATGIGKTHLGLRFAQHGRAADGRAGLIFDMNARGDSQQHHAYAERLFDWPLGAGPTPSRRWPSLPPTEQMVAHYSTPSPGWASPRLLRRPRRRARVDLNWKATYGHALYTVRPFVYFHLGAGSRRIVVDGVEPMDVPADYIQPYIFDELYRKVIHRDSETLGMGCACRCGSTAPSSTPIATITPR